MIRHLVLVPFLAGCFHFKVGHAPGHADIAAPPAAIASSTIEVAGDPGECAVRLDTDLLVLSGAMPTRDGLGAGKQLGLEVSLGFGEAVADLTDREFVRPRLWGLSIGVGHAWGKFKAGQDRTTNAAIDSTWVGTIELRRTLPPFTSVGAGWTYWRIGWNGPEVSTDFGPLLLRVGYLINEGGFALLGLRFGPSFTWATTR